MEGEANDLGDGVRFDLRYLTVYNGGRVVFDYLHLVRSRGLQTRSNAAAMEEDYWFRLAKLRETFAAAIQGDFDLLIDVPSNSGYHRPYLSAVLSKYSQVRCVRFRKDSYLCANPENCDALVSTCHFIKDHDKDLANHHRVLIVDDVYSTGTTARVVITKLLGAGLAPNSSVVVACPLRVVVDESAKAFGDILAANRG
jgi:adenine/guanine phosphoribosyltransferase-like PRPP-binding protein